MFRKVLFIMSLFILLSCNNNKKSEKTNNPQIDDPKQTEIQKRELTFEDRLLDVRDIKDRFNDDLIVDKFGMQKFNDSIFAFVFKLDNQTKDEVVKRYSLGLKGYSHEQEQPFLSNFSPDLSNIEGGKYIVLKRKIKNIRYFDSLDVYIYERKNWKKSGKLGDLMIHDILFE